jgi:hypothetical protein
MKSGPALEMALAIMKHRVMIRSFKAARKNRLRLKKYVYKEDHGRPRSSPFHLLLSITERTPSRSKLTHLTNIVFFNPNPVTKMKSVVALSALAAVASAHYTIHVLVINGQESAGWQYIRENTRAEKYMPTKFINSPSITPLDSDFRCNEGSFTNAGKTQVATVAAGSELSMKLAYGARMQHPVSFRAYCTPT